ncbi:MAG: DUF3221 domain-containing protein [Coriobacteriia bacterium]|nr:DUF3221 domain-containing protein [Coriobacteriia bacterium]
MTRAPRCRNPLLGPLAAAVLASVLLLSACFSAPQPPSEPAGITGSVASVVSGDGRPASMLVESTGTPIAGAISDKAQVNIPPATMFFDSSGKVATLDSIAHIAKGTRVRVWFEGAVAESYPVQGSAKAVQILSK